MSYVEEFFEEKDRFLDLTEKSLGEGNTGYSSEALNGAVTSAKGAREGQLGDNPKVADVVGKEADVNLERYKEGSTPSYQPSSEEPDEEWKILWILIFILIFIS